MRAAGERAQCRGDGRPSGPLPDGAPPLLGRHDFLEERQAVRNEQRTGRDTGQRGLVLPEEIGVPGWAPLPLQVPQRSMAKAN